MMCAICSSVLAETNLTKTFSVESYDSRVRSLVIQGKSFEVVELVQNLAKVPKDQLVEHSLDVGPLLLPAS